MEGDELAKYPGLYQRGGVWYVRKRVPIDLRPLAARDQVRLSLETGERRLAVQRYPFKLAEIERGFDELRQDHRALGKVERSLRTGQLEALTWSELGELASEWWDRRSAARTPDPEDLSDVPALVVQIDDDLQRSLSPRLEDGDVVEALVDRLLVQAGVPARPMKAGVMRTRALYPDLDRSTSQYRYLCDLIRRALEQEASLAKDYLLGHRNTAADPLFNPGGLSPPPDERRVQHLIAEYRAERDALRGKESTDRKFGLLFRVLEEVLGRDLPVLSIARSHCVEVRTFLQSLPPNATKRFPKLTLPEAVERARAERLPGLAPNTVGSYMQNFAAILRWAERGGWGVKPATYGLIETRDPQVQRRGFSPNELHRLFDALAAFRSVEPSKFWVPALALYTGARAGEIIQLRSDDVVQVGDIHCLNLSKFDAGGRRVDSKRLKTAASERYVPLHPHLLEAGFLSFAKGQNGGQSLFPDFEKGEDGYSSRFSKWFGRFKKTVGFNEPALVFHSFRHGFRDACRDVDIPDETAHALGGWARSNQAARYGNRGRVPNLDRAIRQIAFGDFRPKPAATGPVGPLADTF